MENQNLQKAVFGGGCFWCTEAVFKMLRGVSRVYPGYAGGKIPNPTYEQVCTGDTGYVEVVALDFDPEQIKYSDLLTVFFASHNPTEKNRQGADVGTQYASVVFYTTDEQKEQAEKFIEDLNQEKQGDTVVTEVRPLTNFYNAESYHNDYYNRNQDAPYCQVVINPKLEKVQKKFADLLKEVYKK
jgi:methionine-S-sulfoxide reductase